MLGRHRLRGSFPRAAGGARQCGDFETEPAQAQIAQLCYIKDAKGAEVIHQVTVMLSACEDLTGACNHNGRCAPGKEASK